MDICKKERRAKNAAMNQDRNPKLSKQSRDLRDSSREEEGYRFGTSFEVDNLMATSTVEGQKARAFSCPQSKQQLRARRRERNGLTCHRGERGLAPGHLPPGLFLWLRHQTARAAPAPVCCHTAWTINADLGPTHWGAVRKGKSTGQ